VATVVLMLTHHTGGYLAVSAFGAAIGVIILWALFADKDSTAYFDGTLPPSTSG
jgi:methylthioribose-1-phosphate isomerase